MALPRPVDNPTDNYCYSCASNHPYSYNVTSQLQNQPGPSVVGDYTVKGGKIICSFTHRAGSLEILLSTPQSSLCLAQTNKYHSILGGSLTDSSTYTVGVTWSVGISLNLDPASVAGSAGIDASVSTTHSSGKTQGATGICPDGPWHCSLSISPQMVQVSGFATSLDCCQVRSDSTVSPYTVLLPQKSSDGLDHASVDICTCQNFAGWAEPGHPGLICPQDCVE